MKLLPSLKAIFSNQNAYQKNDGIEPDSFATDRFYYREISNLTEAGGWSIDFVAKKSYFDTQARRILKVPEDFVPSLKSGYRFYAQEHMDIATSLFYNCAQGESFDTEIKMQTYDKEIFWVRVKGKPLYNEESEIIGVRGVFQSIDVAKKREEELENSIKIIESHNERLLDFAHIISHNLRSQVSNLQLSATLFEDKNLDADQKELLSNFFKIGEGLDKTLKHLNKIVSVHNSIKKERETVVLQEVYERITGSLSQIIRHNKVKMYSDFSEVEEIVYVEAYLESILQNLLTNAIKYQHPDRDPEINIFTYKEKEKSYLVVKDNGVGLDLDKYGKDLFKLYKTFHGNADAQGLGLFLTRNEVEAMGGTIAVESSVNKGSKFTIQLS